MQVQEVTQGLREFRVSRGFAVISGQRVIRAVKVLREIWDLRDQRDRWDRQDRQVHRETSDRRGPEAFRVRSVPPARPGPWGLRV